MRILIAIYCLLLLGCDSITEDPFSLTREQAVYETVALKYVSNAIDEVFVLDETDGMWFQNQSLNELKEWSSSKEHEKTAHFKAPFKMLEKLHASNQTSYNINWSPLIINGTLVSSENLQNVSSYLAFSKVVFSDNKKYALVQFTHHCILCGGSWISYLKFEDKQWHFIQSRALWLS